MIKRFGSEAALLLTDVHKGVNTFEHCRGPSDGRNNPAAVRRRRDLLGRFRQCGPGVIFSQHDSRDQASPLKLSLPGAG